MAHHGPLGLDMAVRGAQNAAYANIKSRITTAWPLGYLGPGENHCPLITFGFLIPLTQFFSYTLFYLLPELKISLSITLRRPTSRSVADSEIYDNH